MPRRRRKRRLTKNQADYIYQRRRVMQLFNRTARKQGLNTRASDVFRGMPERVTRKMIQELEKLRSGKDVMDYWRNMYSNVNVTTNDLRMEDFLKQFSTLRNYKATEFLYKFFNELTEEFGVETVLDAIAESEAEGNEFYVQMSYYMEALQTYARKITRKAYEIAGEDYEEDPSFVRTLSDLFEEMEDGWEFY